MGVCISMALVGLMMNGKLYSGTFEWSLSFNQICFVMSAPAGIMCPLSIVCVEEAKATASSEADDVATTKGAPRSFASYLKLCWRLLCNRSFFYIVLYFLLEPSVGRVSTTAGSYTKKRWAGVKVLQNQLFGVAGMLVFSGGLQLVKRKFLNTSWRCLIFWTTIMLNLTDMIVVFLTIFDVVRNQYFYEY